MHDRLPNLHHDGTVSYWSHQFKRWIEHAFNVPNEEIETMHSLDQVRVKRHLQYALD